MKTSLTQLSDAAQDFSSLLRRAPGRMPVPASCAVRIVAGLHRGASLRLRQPVVLGSGDDCDLVLRDPDVSARHAELRRVDGRWSAYDLASGLAIPAHQTERRGHYLRQRHAIGATQIVISQAVPLPPARQPVSKVAARVLAPVALVFALSTVAIVLVHLVTPAEASSITTSRSLAAEGWPDVELTTTSNTPTRLKGHVSDGEASKRLRLWMREHRIAEANATVYVGSELAARVREALLEPALQVDYRAGGSVRIQGTSNNLAVRDRIRRLAADLAGVVNLDDRVVYVEAPEPPRTFVLPMRIVDARPGDDETGGSFGTASGERYFVGAVMPDGSEVVAIHDDAIEFSLAGRRVHYPLK